MNRYPFAVPQTEVVENHPNVVKVFLAGVVTAACAKIMYDQVKENRRLKEQLREIEAMRFDQ